MAPSHRGMGAELVVLTDRTENAFPLYFRGIGNEHIPFLPTLLAGDVFPSKWHGQNVIGKHLERCSPPHLGGEGKFGSIWLLNRPGR
jgi:hypothetical protein